VEILKSNLLREWASAMHSNLKNPLTLLFGEQNQLFTRFWSITSRGLDFRFVLSFSLLLSLSGFTYGQFSTREIADTALPAIVVIETDVGTGSGVIIDASGVVATNYHVIETAGTISVNLSTGDQYDEVSVIDFDIVKDIAILKIKGFDLPFVTMGNSNSVGVGDDVIVMGAPEGYEQSVTRGIVSAIREMDEGYRLIQTDAAISSGSSGGGMFDLSGELVGISVAYVKDAQNINFVIPINYYRGMFGTSAKYSFEEFLEVTASETGPRSTETTASSKQTLEELMNALNSELDLDFQKSEDSETWFIVEDGIVVFVNENDNVLLTQVYRQNSEISVSDLTNEELVSLFRESYISNFGKIGIDDEGDFIVLNETHLNAVTVGRFQTILSALLTLDEELASLISESGNRGDEPLPTKPDLNISSNAAPYSEATFIDEHFSIRINLDEWTLDSREDGAELIHARYSSGSSSFQVVAEPAELTHELVADSIRSSAIDIDPNAKIVSSGIRRVNGNDVYWAYLDLSESGAPVTYYYHVYTGPSGTIQLLGASYKNLFESKASDYEEIFSTFILR
jgi:S1-C subfamily serine protease